MNTIFQLGKANKPAGNKPSTVTVIVDEHASLMLEASKLDAEMAMLDNSVEKIQDLEQLLATASQFATTGLSQDGAVFFTSQAEKLRVQLCVPTAITSSMEDFTGTKTDSVDALDASMEAIGDVVANAWEAVINFLKDMYEKVTVFITKLFDTMPNIKKRAEAIKERAGDTDGTAKDKVKFGKMGTIASAKNEWQLATFKNIEKLFNNKALANLVSLGKAESLESLDGSADQVKALKPEDLVTKADITKVHEGLDSTGTFGTGSPAAAQVATADTESKAVNELPGVKAFVVTIPQDAKLGTDGTADEPNRTARLKAISSVKFGIKETVKELKHDKDKEYTAMTTSDVETLCEVVIEGCDAFAKSKGSIESGRKAVTKLTKLAEKLKGNAGKTDYKDVKATLNAAKSAIMKAANLAANPNKELAGYFHGVATAGLDFCEVSLKAHKKD